MKRIVAFVATFALLAVGSILAPATATAFATQPPAFTVRADETVLPSTVGLNKWEGAMIKRGDTLVNLAKEWPELPYVKPGTEIVFTIDGPAPDSMVLRDYVLNEDGTEKYWVDAPQNEVAFAFENGAGSFALRGNFLSLLSSNSEDYEPGRSIRGFKLTCAWGENECEYAFILRTDADMQ